MQTAWVRLHRSCNNRCRFCAEIDHLDGQPIGREAIIAEIDAAADGGAQRIILSGGEPTQSPHLLYAIQRAKRRGLRVRVTSNGRIIASRQIAEMLAAAGLDELHVSILGGRRETHDGLTGVTRSWHQSLEGLRWAAGAGIAVTLKTIITRQNRDELVHLVHLASMGGAREAEIRRLEPVGAADPGRNLSALAPQPREAMLVVNELWAQAKEEHLELTLHGFDDTLHRWSETTGRPLQADRALLALLRRRVALPSAFNGCTALDDDGRTRDFARLVEASGGGLAQVGGELSARYSPLLDVPPCVGGVRRDEGDAAHDAVHAEACALCPRAERCHGLPARLGKLAAGQLQPRPEWSPWPDGARVRVLSPDNGDLWLDRILSALSVSLVARGIDCARVSARDFDPGDADIAIAGTPAVARDRVAAGGPRWIVVDLRAEVAIGDGVWSKPHDVRWLSSAPGEVGAYVEAGVPLARVEWRPHPVPPIGEAQPPTGPPVVLGETADWTFFDAVVGPLSPGEWTADVFVFGGDGPTAVPGLAIRRDRSFDDVLDAIRRAPYVALPLRRHVDGPLGRAVRLRDVAWAGVAMALGRPVLGTYVPVLDDHVAHEVTGWLASVDDAASFCRGLRALRTVAVRNRLGDAARIAAAAGSVDVWADDLVAGRNPEPAPGGRRSDRAWAVW